MDEPAEAAGREEAPGAAGSPHSRRYVLARLAAALLVAGAALALQRLVLADEPSRSTFGATVRTKEIESDLLGKTMTTKVVVPKGAPPKDRSLVVFLHGRGENASSYLVEPMFEALASLGAGRAPVIAFPDGGDSSYWHDRDSGRWASYVLSEVIPTVIERYDIDPDEVAIGGISMGGFGAFDIARLDPGRFCAVAGHSPAIWKSFSEAADGAFDDAADFDRNNIIEIAGGATNPYGDLRVWLDAGSDDPFLDGDSALEAALREAGVRPIVKSGPGGHDLDYWNDNWSEYLRWYAHALKECGEEAERARLRADRRPRGKLSGSSDRSRREARRGGASSR